MLTVKNYRQKNESPTSRLKTQVVLNFMNLRVFVARKADTNPQNKGVGSHWKSDERSEPLTVRVKILTVSRKKT